MSIDHISGNYRPCGNRDRRKSEVGFFIIPQAALCTLQKQHMPQRKHEPGNLRYSPNVGSMLDQRRRRWANIDSTLDNCLVVYVYSTRPNDWFCSKFRTKFQSLLRPRYSLLKVYLIQNYMFCLGFPDKNHIGSPPVVCKLLLFILIKNHLISCCMVMVWFFSIA